MTLRAASGAAGTVVIPAGVGASGTFIQSNGTAWAASAYTLPAAVGGAGTILRSDGTNYAVSQTTYPDLVGSGNVLFATAANTVGSSANLTFNATGSLLTLGTDMVVSRASAAVAMISGDGTGTASGQTGWRIGNAVTTLSAIWASGLTPSTSNFALGQNSSGDTTVQAATGRSLFLDIAAAHKISIASTGVVTVASLAGTGTRTVVADASGVLSAP